MKKYVLLTGATGTVGKETLKLLCKNPNYSITILGRDSLKNRKKLAPFMDKVKLIHADLSKENDMAKLIGIFDVVIHLAAIIPPLANKVPTIIYI